MVYLNVPADAEKVSAPHGIFCEVKKYTLLWSTSRWKSIKIYLTMASRLSVYDGLERLDDDDDGLYSEDESDCEAEGISGYMPEAMTTSWQILPAEKPWMTTKKKALMMPLLQRSLLVQLQVSIYIYSYF